MMTRLLGMTKAGTPVLGNGGRMMTNTLVGATRAEEVTVIGTSHGSIDMGKTPYRDSYAATIARDRDAALGKIAELQNRVHDLEREKATAVCTCMKRDWRIKLPYATNVEIMIIVLLSACALSGILSYMWLLLRGLGWV